MKALFLFVFVFSCRAEPTPPGPLTPSGGTVFEQACANLQRLHCPEASPRAGSCAELLERIENEGNLGIHSSCIADAPDVEALHVCHVRCVHPD